MSKLALTIAMTLLAALAAVALLSGPAAGRPIPGASACPVFPKDNWWNLRVDRLPVASGSSRIVRRIGAGGSVHPDFGSGTYDGGPIGIPFVVVGKGQKKVPVSFEYDDESDGGRYPIPRNAPIEGGRSSDGDRHVIVVDKDACRLYEVYASYPRNGGSSWSAGSGAIYNLRSNKLRPKGWTSADAAGLPILPGLARYDEVKKGSIDHALRFTVAETRRAFVYPARHFAASSNDADLPPMGMRFRLKKSVAISRLPKQARVVAKALRLYGMVLADNGSDWYISGAPNPGWDNDQLRALGSLQGSDFEVVDTGALRRPK